MINSVELVLIVQFGHLTEQSCSVLTQKEATAVNNGDRAFGTTLRQFRVSRRKSLRVLAGLAGISKSKLSALERGEPPAPSVAQIAALAEALGVAPSDLTHHPVPTLPNADDGAIEDVRLALMAVSHGYPAGYVVGTDVLRERLGMMIAALCRCERGDGVSKALPGLIHDAHTSLRSGRDTSAALGLTTLLHSQIVVPWLRLAGAPLDLCSQAVLLAQHTAHQHGTPISLGLAALTASRTALATAALNLAYVVLDEVVVPTTTPALMQLAGFRALRLALVAGADGRKADLEALVEHAAELAQRTGEGNTFGLGFGPTAVGIFRMSGLVEAGDYEEALRVASDLPRQHPNPSGQTYFWVTYSRAASRVRGYEVDAVRALRRAEVICPRSVQRSQVAQKVILDLLMRVRRDTPGRELRGLAYRAGVSQ